MGGRKLRSWYRFHLRVQGSQNGRWAEIGNFVKVKCRRVATFGLRFLAPLALDRHGRASAISARVATVSKVHRTFFIPN